MFFLDFLPNLGRKIFQNSGIFSFQIGLWVLNRFDTSFRVLGRFWVASNRAPGRVGYKFENLGRVGFRDGKVNPIFISEPGSQDFEVIATKSSWAHRFYRKTAFLHENYSNLRFLLFKNTLFIEFDHFVPSQSAVLDPIGSRISIKPRPGQAKISENEANSWMGPTEFHPW